ncbi:MAG TPA: ATP-binding protein, partial [bacterium]|nr:ATP-binding protein [bacterium]
MRFGTNFRAENADRMRVKLGLCLERQGVASADVHLILSMADELICNVMEHGHATWVEVELQMRPESEQLALILRDDGIPFDPGEINKQALPEESLQHGSERHLGLYLVSRIAASWKYRRTNDGTVNEMELAVDKRRPIPAQNP